MIIEGVSKINNTSLLLTQQAAKELLNDLQYAIEESKDHMLHAVININVSSQKENPLNEEPSYLFKLIIGPK